MRFLGIDYGTKKIGLALSDENKQFALPLVVLPNTNRVLGEIAEIIEKENVSGIVMGKSLNYQGKENPVMKEVYRFKKQLEDAFHLPVFLESETLTSAEAKRIQGEHDALDASAAALILKSYLDTHKIK